MMNRIMDSNYYGIPKNMDFDGVLPTGGLCQTFTRQGIKNSGQLNHRWFKHNKYFHHCNISMINLICWVDFLNFFAGVTILGVTQSGVTRLGVTNTKYSW